MSYANVQDDDELFSSAKETIQKLHEWGLNSDNEQRKIAETAKMYKATLSLMGQRKKPGGSVNVIISQSKILNQDNLAKSTTISKMVTFLNGFIQPFDMVNCASQLRRNFQYPCTLKSKGETVFSRLTSKQSAHH